MPRCSRQATLDLTASCRRAMVQALVVATTGVGSAADPVTLGRTLFFDVNLSRNRVQACATCHDPSYAFADPRDNGVGGAASLGADGRSLGRRNAPALTYGFMAPDFHWNTGGEPIGGFFHDGRASTLMEQAAGPLLSPIELDLGTSAMVAERAAGHLGTSNRNVQPDGSERALGAVTRSLAAYQSTPEFASFDSRYDRYLRGEYQMTPEEDAGRKLFFSSLTSCSECHVLHRDGTDAREPFTNYRYHNIGVPANPALAGPGPDHPDLGLLERPDVEDAVFAGSFKVPSLRNVAVTPPYMHNGVFRTLRTAIAFYGKYLVRNRFSATNPETGSPWRSPEVPLTVNRTLLRMGQPLDARRIDQLAAFLGTLTDRRYEHLLNRR